MGAKQANAFWAMRYALFATACLFLLRFTVVDDSPEKNEKKRTPVIIYNVSQSTRIELEKIDSILLNTGKSDSVTHSTNISTNYFNSLLITAKTWKKQKRKCPIIRYYAKPLDSSKVFDLNEYGYYIHQRPSIGLENYSSNTISYGDSIAQEDLLLLAYSLITVGLDIKDIRLSKYHNGWKAKALEVGTDTTILNNRSITISDLVEIYDLD